MGDSVLVVNAGGTIGMVDTPDGYAPVPGALGHVIRVLIHYYAAEAHRAHHVYLEGARALRTDLDAAQ